MKIFFTRVDAARLASAEERAASAEREVRTLTEMNRFLSGIVTAFKDRPAPIFHPEVQTEKAGIDMNAIFEEDAEEVERLHSDLSDEPGDLI